MNNVPDAGLARLSRYTAWIAFVVILLFILTGYGMTKRIIDPDLAKFLHNKVLPLALIVSLLAHGGICARSTLRRWGVFRSNVTIDLYVAAIGLVLFVLFLWMYLR